MTNLLESKQTSIKSTSTQQVGLAWSKVESDGPHLEGEHAFPWRFKKADADFAVFMEHSECL